MKKWIEGTVNWFDSEEGEGSVICKNEGISYYVHYSAINTKNSFKLLKAGQKVRFKLYENRYMKQVDLIEVLNSSDKEVRL